MKYFPYVILGAILGAIHGLILWAAKTTFSSVIIPIAQTKTAHLMMAPLYRQAFTQDEVIYNSLMVAGYADNVIILTIVSAVWWLPKLERLVFNYLEE